jgi:hypothetical protein
MLTPYYDISQTEVKFTNEDPAGRLHGFSNVIQDFFTFAGGPVMQHMTYLDLRARKIWMPLRGLIRT